MDSFVRIESSRLRCWCEHVMSIVETERKKGREAYKKDVAEFNRKGWWFKLGNCGPNPYYDDYRIDPWGGQTYDIAKSLLAASEITDHVTVSTADILRLKNMSSTDFLESLHANTGVYR